MGEIEVLEQIAHNLHLIHSDLAGIGIVLFLMLCFKDMGRRYK